MKIEFLEIAKFELDDAVEFYELAQSGLGKRFKSEVKKSIGRIERFPFASPVEIGEVRKSIMDVFPYKIMYSLGDKTIIVLAIAHQHRKPYYWADRIKST